MNLKFVRRLAVLAALLTLILCLPVAGMAEELTYDVEYQYAKNSDVYIWFQMDFFSASEYSDIYDFLSEKIICDYDADGTIEAEELNQNVSIEWTGAAFTGGADEVFGKESWYSHPANLRAAILSVDTSFEEKTVKLTLTNVNTGDKFTTNYSFQYLEVVEKPVDIKCSTDDYQIEEDEYGRTLVTINENESVTVTINHKYEGNENVTYEYVWSFFDFDSQDETILPGGTNTYTFDVTKEGTLSCTTKINGASGWNMFEKTDSVIVYFTYEEPPMLGNKVTFNPVTSPVVVDDTIMVNEGQTVTINTNAVCSDPTVDIEYHWTIDTYDDEGNYTEEIQENVGASFQFTATEAHDGKWVWCFGWPVGGDEGDSLYYQIKVIRTSTVALDEEKATKLNNVLTTEAEKLGISVTTGLFSCDVKLQVKENGKWVELTEENWPRDNRGSKIPQTVHLAYPAGTSSANEFVIIHELKDGSQEIFYSTASDPAKRVRKEDMLRFEVTSLSPIVVKWSEPVVATVPSTGDNATPFLWMLGMLIAGAGCAAMLFKRRQHN